MDSVPVGARHDSMRGMEAAPNVDDELQGDARPSDGSPVFESAFCLVASLLLGLRALGEILYAASYFGFWSAPGVFLIEAALLSIAYGCCGLAFLHRSTGRRDGRAGVWLGVLMLSVALTGSYWFLIDREYPLHSSTYYVVVRTAAAWLLLVMLVVVALRGELIASRRLARWVLALALLLLAWGVGSSVYSWITDPPWEARMELHRSSDGNETRFIKLYSADSEEELAGKLAAGGDDDAVVHADEPPYRAEYWAKVERSLSPTRRVLERTRIIGPGLVLPGLLKLFLAAAVFRLGRYRGALTGRPGAFLGCAAVTLGILATLAWMAPGSGRRWLFGMPGPLATAAFAIVAGSWFLYLAGRSRPRRNRLVWGAAGAVLWILLVSTLDMVAKRVFEDPYRRLLMQFPDEWTIATFAFAGLFALLFLGPVLVLRRQPAGLLGDPPRQHERLG